MVPLFWGWLQGKPNCTPHPFECLPMLTHSHLDSLAGLESGWGEPRIMLGQLHEALRVQPAQLWSRSTSFPRVEIHSICPWAMLSPVRFVGLGGWGTRAWVDRNEDLVAPQNGGFPFDVPFETNQEGAPNKNRHARMGWLQSGTSASSRKWGSARSIACSKYIERGGIAAEDPANVLKEDYNGNSSNCQVPTSQTRPPKPAWSLLCWASRSQIIGPMPRGMAMATWFTLNPPCLTERRTTARCMWLSSVASFVFMGCSKSSICLRILFGFPCCF